MCRTYSTHFNKFSKLFGRIFLRYFFDTSSIVLRYFFDPGIEETTLQIRGYNVINLNQTERGSLSYIANLSVHPQHLHTLPPTLYKN